MESGSPITTRVKAPPSSYYMDLGSMAWASSVTSSASFRHWKNEKRCFEKFLGERLRYPILPWTEDLAWRGPYRRRVRAPSFRTCAVLELPTNLERKSPTKIQRWPATL